MYRGDVRSVLLARWPKKLKSGKGGRSRDRIVLVVVEPDGAVRIRGAAWLGRALRRGRNEERARTGKDLTAFRGKFLA